MGSSADKSESRNHHPDNLAPTAYVMLIAFPIVLAVTLRFMPGRMNVFPNLWDKTGATNGIHLAELSGPGKMPVRFVRGTCLGKGVFLTCVALATKLYVGKQDSVQLDDDWYRLEQDNRT